MHKIVIASDSFKGSLTSLQVAEAVTEGIREIYPDCNILPVILGDGGEGTADSIAENISGEWVSVPVLDPLGRTITARYLIFNRSDVKTAVIELAQASGLTLVKDWERDPMLTSTFGTGQMICDAILKGCRHILLCLGGSATNDAGTGLLEALGFRFLDSEGKGIKGCCGCKLSRIASIDASSVPLEISSSTFTLACDVDTVFCGDNGATRVFAAQKGADADAIRILEDGMQSLSGLIREQFGTDLSLIEGSGAAGGVAGLLHLLLDASLINGADLILDASGFEEKIRNADLIITGEGKIDSQTFMGKLPSAILERSQKTDIPVICICGISEIGSQMASQSGFSMILPIQPYPQTKEELQVAMTSSVASANIRHTIRRYLESLV